MSESAKDLWVGFDLGGTKMLAMVFDGEFRPLGRKRRRTRGHEGSEAGQARIIQTIRDAIEDADVSTDRIAGIGIGCPGPLDLIEGTIIDAPNLGWENVPIKSTLEKEFDRPVTVLNDVDAGVYGESLFGAAKGARCTLGVFPGTGIGGGCVYDGQIIRGTRNSCMEIGHMQVVPNGPHCGCGLQGCLETVAGRLAISAAAAQASYRGQAPHLRSLIGTDLSLIRSGTLAAAVASGDEAIEEILKEAARHFGRALGGVIHLLAPDCIVLGGGLVEAMPNLFRDNIGKTARRSVMPSFQKTFEVVTSKLADDASVMGAAAWSKAGAEKERVGSGKKS